MSSIPESVRMLEHELRGVFGSRLQSLVLYGARVSAHASGHRHEHGHAPAAPTRTLGVVDSLTGDDLRACAGRVEAWHDAGLATPLLLAAREFEQSLDVFPLEFGAILADHTLVSGANPFERSTVEGSDVRRAVEVQARSHLLHLREGYLETRGRGDALSLLIVQSAAPFAALLMGLARLDGRPTDDPAAAARHAERLLQVPGGAIAEVVALVGRDLSSHDAEHLFPAYLDAVEKLVAYVDGWRDGR
jgi:hypothetical protein